DRRYEAERGKHHPGLVDQKTAAGADQHAQKRPSDRRGPQSAAHLAGGRAQRRAVQRTVTQRPGKIRQGGHGGDRQGPARRAGEDPRAERYQKDGSSQPAREHHAAGNALEQRAPPEMYRALGSAKLGQEDDQGPEDDASLLPESLADGGELRGT